MQESHRLRKIMDYLKKNLKKGYTEESLKWALINQGYTRILVEQAIRRVHEELAEEAPKIEEKPVIRHVVFDEEDTPIEIPQKKKSWWGKLWG